MPIYTFVAWGPFLNWIWSVEKNTSSYLFTVNAGDQKQPTLVQVNLYIRSMGPISEMDMVGQFETYSAWIFVNVNVQCMGQMHAYSIIKDGNDTQCTVFLMFHKMAAMRESLIHFDVTHMMVQCGMHQ